MQELYWVVGGRAVSVDSRDLRELTIAEVSSEPRVLQELAVTRVSEAQVL